MICKNYMNNKTKLLKILNLYCDKIALWAFRNICRNIMLLLNSLHLTIYGLHKASTTCAASVTMNRNVKLF